MGTVILISGKAGHGKDTFAESLRCRLKKNNYKVLTLHFADLVKTYATMYFNWNGEKDIAGRQLLQEIGNNTFRKFDPDYWARITAECARVMIDYFGYDFILIPDNRYPNEINVMKEYNNNVITVRIKRYDDYDRIWVNPNMTAEQLVNEGEIALDYHTFNYIIKNRNLSDIQDSAEMLFNDLTSK